jgi:ribosomal protein L37AE/L43A
MKEEDLKAAAKRKEEYALGRDLQATEFNEAITDRLAKDSKHVKCEKCGKEFLVEITIKGLMNCPECNRIIEIG